MIEIFRHNGKWRINIRNETLEFDNLETMKEIMDTLIEMKEKFEPYKYKNKEQENE